MSGQDATHLEKLTDLGGWVWGVAYHPDGGLLAANVEKKLIRLVDPNSKRELFSGYAPALAELELLQFSPDGALLATAGTTHDGGYGIGIWQVDRQHGLSRVCSILPSEHPIESLAFSPDSRKLVAGGSGVTRVWHLPPMPGSLEEVQSQTRGTLGFLMDEQDNPVFADLSTKEVAEVRARLTQAQVPTAAPLEAALKLPPAEALAALESLARQHPDSSVYPKLQSHLHTELMERNVQQGLWKEALAHVNEAFRLGDHDPLILAQRAILFWLAGDVAGYQASCAALVERYQSREDLWVVNAVVGAVAISPEALDDYSSLVEQVRRSLPLAGGVDGPAQRFELGFVLARAGHYAEAVKELEEVDRFLATGVRVGFPPALHKFMISICHAHLGDLEEARRWFDVAAKETEPLLQPNEATFDSSGYYWWRRSALEVFMQEAEALLKPSPSKPSHSE